MYRMARSSLFSYKNPTFFFQNDMILDLNIYFERNIMMPNAVKSTLVRSNKIFSCFISQNLSSKNVHERKVIPDFMMILL